MSKPAASADVLIIGAGPSGAVAGARLIKLGYTVQIVERQSFPRFSIGESLLPQCMHFIEEAGLLDVVQAAGFQTKNGARFECGELSGIFDFSDKFTPGWATTYEVQRDSFDKILADEAERKGARISYRETVTAIDIAESGVSLDVSTDDGDKRQYRGRFLLDASGFGRVLPRLLDLEKPSDFPVRQSIFTHVDDRIDPAGFDREKILITIHPQQRSVWYWLIPFSNGRSSLGVVAEPEFLEGIGDDDAAVLKQLVSEAPGLKAVLADAVYDRPVQKITGYSASVQSLYGQNYALLGNAAEFLDPVFSSGVTIAMKSASLAANAIDKQFRGQAVDWDEEFARPLMVGVDTFRAYVNGWYDQSLQDIIFFPRPNPDIKAMVCSILAGYAWDENNAYVREAARRMATLAVLCRPADRSD